MGSEIVACIGRLIRRDFLWRRAKAAAPSPVVEFGPKGVDGTHSIVDVPMDGHGFATLPPLDGSYVAFEVDRDFFPGIEAVVDGWFEVR
jgi:hypothetical protein